VKQRIIRSQKERRKIDRSGQGKGRIVKRLLEDQSKCREDRIKEQVAQEHKMREETRVLNSPLREKEEQKDRSKLGTETEGWERRRSPLRVVHVSLGCSRN
jgi:hypothetical protein